MFAFIETISAVDPVDCKYFLILQLKILIES